MKKTKQEISGIHYSQRRLVDLEIMEGRISAIHERGEGSLVDAGRKTHPMLAPALVDLQVNGFAGIDFNAPGLEVSAVESASRRLLEQGVGSYLPTLITGPPERISQNISVLRQAHEAGGLSAKLIGGIHLEGPFISEEDGPRGAHPAAYCRRPDTALLERWQEEARGRVKILTLAPELPGSLELVNRCLDLGIVPAIGHTGASPEAIRAAVDAGARLSTHLGNGAHGVLPRHPNYIWEQLAEARLYASMIGDGFHLPASVLKVFYASKGKKAILVSDSMVYAGLEPGTYESPATGGRVVLTAEGKLHLEGKPGTLAGSASSLLQGVRHTSEVIGWPQAWDMASLHARALLAFPPPFGLQTGAKADLVSLGKEGGKLEVRQVYLEGEPQL